MISNRKPNQNLSICKRTKNLTRFVHSITEFLKFWGRWARWFKSDKPLRIRWFSLWSSWTFIDLLNRWSLVWTDIMNMIILWIWNLLNKPICQLIGQVKRLPELWSGNSFEVIELRLGCDKRSLSSSGEHKKRNLILGFRSPGIRSPFVDL